MALAAGTSPNVTYEKEAPNTFRLDAKKKFFQPHRIVRTDEGRPELLADGSGFFTSYEKDGRFVSYYGDNHPRFAGNVVKAMASAERSQSGASSRSCLVVRSRIMIRKRSASKPGRLMAR